MSLVSLVPRCSVPGIGTINVTILCPLSWAAEVWKNASMLSPLSPSVPSQTPWFSLLLYVPPGPSSLCVLALADRKPLCRLFGCQVLALSQVHQT